MAACSVSHRSTLSDEFKYCRISYCARPLRIWCRIIRMRMLLLLLYLLNNPWYKIPVPLFGFRKSHISDGCIASIAYSNIRYSCDSREIHWLFMNAHKCSLSLIMLAMRYYRNGLRRRIRTSQLLAASIPCYLSCTIHLYILSRNL